MRSPGATCAGRFLQDVCPPAWPLSAACRLRKALLKLREINSLVWGDYLPPAQPLAAQQAGPAGKAAAPSQRSAAHARRLLGDSALQQPLLAPHREEGDVEAGSAAAAATQQAPLLAAVVDGATGVAARPAEEASDAAMLKCEKVRASAGGWRRRGATCAHHRCRCCSPCDN